MKKQILTVICTLLCLIGYNSIERLARATDKTTAKIEAGTDLPDSCGQYDLFLKTTATVGFYYCEAASWKRMAAATETSAVPTGSILLVNSGSCPNGFSEVSALDGKTLFGTLAAHSDVGGTGGSDTITPAGTVAAPIFTGSLASLTHSGTAVANHSFTQPTVAWPAGVPTAANESAHTHSITSNVAVADHASHTHTYTDVPNHVHVQAVNSGTTGALSGYTPDTSTSTSTSSGYSTANNTGGVATGTTNGPGATLTHTITNNAVTSGAGSSHTHTLSWPAGVPTNSSGAVDAHSVTQPNAHSYTPAGTNSAPSFTGTQFDNRSAYAKVIFCKKD